MVALIALGLLSALFFSSTFVLNRLMSLEGGSLGLVGIASLCFYGFVLSHCHSSFSREKTASSSFETFLGTLALLDGCRKHWFWLFLRIALL